MDESTVDTTTRMCSGQKVRPVEQLNLRQTKVVRFAQGVLEEKYDLFLTNYNEQESIGKKSQGYDIDTVPIAAHFITAINARVKKEGVGYAQ